MKEHPILFSGEMVRAILDGRKTMTRRVVKPQPPKGTDKCIYNPSAFDPDNGFYFSPYGVFVKCPYGQVSDRLWMRETWVQDDVTPEDIYYRANYDNKAAKEMFNDVGLKWKPSIFMPRWASRITLEITNIRVERLRDISEEDAVKEGLISDEINQITAAENFENLWDSINGKKYPWASNPWVWCLEFKKL